MKAELDVDKSNNYDFSFTDIKLSHASNLKLQITGQSNSMNKVLEDNLMRSLLFYLTEQY